MQNANMFNTIFFLFLFQKCNTRSYTFPVAFIAHADWLSHFRYKKWIFFAFHKILNSFGVESMEYLRILFSRTDTIKCNLTNSLFNCANLSKNSGEGSGYSFMFHIAKSLPPDKCSAP